MSDLATRKATVRRLVLARRAQVTDEQRAAAATAVSGRIAALPELAKARTILGFASVGAELSTDPVMQWVLASGRRLLAPYVDGPELRAAEVRSLEELAPGYRGIREPVERTPVDPAEAAVVLVPGVAFDEAGRRLGYGGGFYDSFLAGIAAAVPRVGLCFDFQVVEEVPAGPQDEHVDLVVTERRVGPTPGNPEKPAARIAAMPTYEYECLKCGRRTEVVQRFSDEPLHECPHCGGPLRRVFHPVGIVLKESGFYSTDNRGGSKHRQSEPKKDAAASDSKSETKKESKSDSKPSPSSEGSSSAKKSDGGSEKAK